MKVNKFQYIVFVAFFFFCCCAHFFVLYLMKLALELISSEDDWCLCCTSLSSLWLDSFLYENILIKCILQFALFSSSMSGFRWVYMQKRYKLISLKYWVLVVHEDFFCPHLTSIELALSYARRRFLKNHCTLSKCTSDDLLFPKM